MIFILCHSLRWIPNIWELKHSGLKKVTSEKRCNLPSARLSFQSSGLGPPTPSPARECCSPPLGPRGETTEYTECQAFFPVVRIGSPHPFTRKGVLLPPLIQGERPQSIQSAGFLRSELVPPLPHPPGSVDPPPFGSKGGRNTRLRVRG